MEKVELREGVIEHLGNRYEKATSRMKAYPEWDENAHRMKREFLIDLLQNPTEEKLTQVKDTIQFGLSNEVTKPHVEKEIRKLMYEIQVAKTTKDIVAFIRHFE
jgi:hypothetical protein